MSSKTASSTDRGMTSPPSFSVLRVLRSGSDKMCTCSRTGQPFTDCGISDMPPVLG